MTDLTAEAETKLERIALHIEAIAQDITAIKSDIERLIQAIVGENTPESLAMRAALRQDRLRKRQATLASRDANRSVEDAAPKPRQTKMVERWKFLTAVAIAVLGTLTAIATALIN